MEADEPATVYTVNNPNEAEVIKMALQGEGISCQLDGEGQAGFSDIFAIGILVRARDADRARKILAPTDAKRQGPALRLHTDAHYPDGPTMGTWCPSPSHIQ